METPKQHTDLAAPSLVTTSCPISPSPAPAQPPPKEEAKELVGSEVATAGEEQERAKNKGKAEPQARWAAGPGVLPPAPPQVPSWAKEAELHSDASNHPELEFFLLSRTW